MSLFPSFTSQAEQLSVAAAAAGTPTSGQIYLLQRKYPIIIKIASRTRKIQNCLAILSLVVFEQKLLATDISAADPQTDYKVEQHQEAPKP